LDAANDILRPAVQFTRNMSQSVHRAKFIVNKHSTGAIGWFESARLAQNNLHEKLSRYVNGGIFSRSDRLLGLFSPARVLRRHSDEVIQVFRAYRDRLVLPAVGQLNVEVEAYRGKNQHAYRMMEYLDRHLKQDVLGAYAHGSIGTYDEIAYSDFDGLVILKADVFEAPARLASVAQKLQHAAAIMYEYDPLQHHGWFVLTEDDLPFYCEAYFPVELFRYAKSLTGERGRYLSIATRESHSEITETLKTVASSIIRKIEQGRLPTNVYQLKCLTSEFMLLPALYAQRKTGSGLFKKFSFQHVESEFAPATWEIMNQVSTLRTAWHYRVSSVQRWMLTRPNVLRYVWARKYSPPIPPDISRQLTHSFYESMHKLAAEMMRHVNECDNNASNVSTQEH
jgi:hypothetical protein